MKRYIIPITTIVKIESQRMIANSVPIDGNYDGEEILSREDNSWRKGKDVWGDDEE